MTTIWGVSAVARFPGVTVPLQKQFGSLQVALLQYCTCELSAIKAKASRQSVTMLENAAIFSRASLLSVFL